MTEDFLPIRVAYNATPLLSPLTGVGQYTKNLLSGLQARKDVSILSFYGLRWSQNTLVDISFEYQTYRSTFSKTFKKYIPNSYTLARKAKQMFFSLGEKHYKPDLYHETNFLAYNSLRPTVVTVHDLSWIHFPEMHPIERVRAMDKYFEPSLRQAKRIITDSEYVKNELVEVFGVRPEMVTAVPLAAEVLLQPLNQIQSRDVLRARGITFKSYWISVGTLEPRKNLQLVLKAFMCLPKSIRQACPLIIVGLNGWNNHSLEAELNPLIQSGEVLRFGYLSREELAVLIAGAKTLIYPSFYEGFGLPLLEAMCCGVPVIASNVASHPQLVGGVGILIDPKDVEGLKNQMLRLFSDESLCASLGAIALQHSYQFSWDKCTKDTVKVYREALA